MKRLMVALTTVLVLSGCAANVRRGVVEDYDRFANRTRFSTHDLEIRPWPQTPTLRLSARYAVEGQESKASGASTVYVVFNTSTLLSSGWQFLKNHRFVFLVDGKPTATQELTHDGEIGDSWLYETMVLTLAKDDFLKVARARKIEGRIGYLEFALTDEHIAALSDLADKLSSQPE